MSEYARCHGIGLSMMQHAATLFGWKNRSHDRGSDIFMHARAFDTLLREPNSDSNRPCHRIACCRCYLQQLSFHLKRENLWLIFKFPEKPMACTFSQQRCI